MNTVQPLTSNQSSNAHLFAGIVRPILTASLLGAALMTFGSIPAKAETPKPNTTHSAAKLKDNHRVYNPQTGNFEEAPPYGPRSNK